MEKGGKTELLPPKPANIHGGKAVVYWRAESGRAHEIAPTSLFPRMLATESTTLHFEFT